jgi:hypothetical protein
MESSQSPSELMALEGRVRNTQMPLAIIVEGHPEAFLRGESFLALSWLLHPCIRGFGRVRLALLGQAQVVLRDVVVGGAVGLHFNAFLLPGDDDATSVSTSVDDIAEIDRGEVIEVVGLMLLQRAMTAFGVFGVSEPAVFSLDVVFGCYLHGVCGVESVFGRPMNVEAHRRVRILDGRIREVAIVIVDAVVIELDVFQSFIVQVLDFCDANHENPSLQREVFDSPCGLPFFFVRRDERPAFLWEFAGVGSRA